MEKERGKEDQKHQMVGPRKLTKNQRRVRKNPPPVVPYSRGYLK
uniref:Wssv173 n=1 Tax=White spot syndrome virus TaxID=342409 RepID=A0A3G5BHL2_9VIRU|nr:wssv173 [White spot syndrome virus]